MLLFKGPCWRDMRVVTPSRQGDSPQICHIQTKGGIAAAHEAQGGSPDVSLGFWAAQAKPCAERF